MISNYIIIFTIIITCAIVINIILSNKPSSNEYFTDTFNLNNLEYTKFVNQYKLTGYSGSSNNIVIPAVVNTFPVTIIDENVFQNNITITSVTIPNSVTLIRSSAFDGTTNLSQVIINDLSNLNSINKNAFQGSSITSITIPQNVTFIGDNVFNNCSKLSSVFFNGPKNYIGTDAFSSININAIGYHSPHPTWITFRTTNNKINDLSLEYLYQKTDDIEYKLYNNTYIVFRCININQTDINIPAFIDKIPIVEIYDYAFKDSKIKNIFIPNTITVIGEEAFYNTSSLTNVLISNLSKLTTIKSKAFYRSNIYNIQIPISISQIDSFAFYRTSSLTNIILPEQCPLTIIDESVFEYSNIKNITLPSKIVSINENAFNNTNNLNEIILNDNLNIINKNAFYNSNISKIVIPSSVTKIEFQSFYKCNNLKYVYFNGNIPIIGVNAFKSINTRPYSYAYYRTMNKENWNNINNSRIINKKLDDLLVRDVLYDKDMLSLSIYGKIKPEIYSKAVGTIINQYLLILNTNIWTTIPSPIVYFGGNLYYDINTGYINGLDNTKNYKIDVILHHNSFKIDIGSTYELTLITINNSSTSDIKSQKYQIANAYPFSIKISTFIKNCTSITIGCKIITQSKITVTSYDDNNVKVNTNISLSIFEI